MYLGGVRTIRKQPSVFASTIHTFHSHMSTSSDFRRADIVSNIALYSAVVMDEDFLWIHLPLSLRLCLVISTLVMRISISSWHTYSEYHDIIRERIGNFADCSNPTERSSTEALVRKSNRVPVSHVDFAISWSFLYPRTSAIHIYVNDCWILIFFCFTRTVVRKCPCQKPNGCQSWNYPLWYLGSTSDGVIRIGKNDFGHWVRGED